MSSFSRLPESLNLDDPSEPFTRRSWRYGVRRLLRRSRDLLGDDPVFLPIVLRATPMGTSRLIDDDTEVVIEGFPRSGNTFAFFALRHAEGRDVRIASHVHTPSQVKLAVQQRFPTLVVIRRPVDAVTSELILAPHARFTTVLREYTHHYRELWPWRDRFVVATFDQVTTDFGAVTARLNRRFGTTFACFDHTDANVDAVFAALDAHHQDVHPGSVGSLPRPSELRKAEKDWVHEQLASPRYAGLLAEADAVYADYVGAAD